MRPARALAAGLVALAALGAFGCVSAAPPPVDPVVAARQAADDSRDGEVLGRWLLTELVAPGGSGDQAGKARQRLDAVAKDQKGLYASIARGLDDEMHGSLGKAAASYLDALTAAHDGRGAEAPLLAWYATTRLLWLRGGVAELWSRARPTVEKLIEDPGRIGARARVDLVDWWLYDAMRERGAVATDVRAKARQRLGCVDVARFAGPFGRPAPLDLVSAFDAEKPGAWPKYFPKEPTRSAAPHVMKGEIADGVCGLTISEPSETGIYYAETFLELEHPTELLLLVKGAWSVRVDDREVLAHDPRVFATWARPTVGLSLGAGRHRVLARLSSAETMIRITDLAGKPLALPASDDPSKPYSLEAPKVLPDPSPLADFATASSSPAPATFPRRPASWAALDTDDPVLRFFGAELAHADGLDDLATVIAEPLVKEPSRATPTSLSQASLFLENDPIFAENDARDLALDYRQRAVEKDARLWFSQLWLLMDQVGKQREKESLEPLSQLALDFPEVPAIGRALANVYARVGYKAEQKRTIVSLAKRFPNDVEVQKSYLSVLDEEGSREEADALAARIDALEPESNLRLERSIRRGELEEAAVTLSAEAEKAAGQDKKRTLRRAADLLVRAGKRRETFELLERALEEDPKSARANLDLADAGLARGKHDALRRALAHALRVGSDTGELRDAIELVDGMSELEPFRADPRRVIAEFETSGAAKAGLSKKQGGTAARVLDYAALWVHADGSARMLEHEILHMQSVEAIRQHAEQRLSNGKLLRIRTIKTKDGGFETFEPELVSGKPTATMPHLEVGDYIETETLYDLPSDGRGGLSFTTPRWFFREEKIDYHQSEFVLITPKDRPLAIETTGEVPAPQVSESGGSVIRRYRVDKSPALPDEEFSAPVREFLPSLRGGWGITQKDTLERLLDASTRLSPADPRLVRIAKTIATNGAKPDVQEAELAKLDPIEKSRRVYRWVLDNIEPSRENDPRKSVVGKSGSPLEAFLYLTRLLGVETRHALVVDRLKPPPRGPLEEAEMFTSVAVAVPDGKGGDVWTMVENKYAPFGYLPSALRGQPAVVLRPGLPRVTTGEDGPRDGVTHVAKVVLAADGSAKVTLDQTYSGMLAIYLRDQIQKVGDQERLKAAVEAELLPRSLPGAKILSFEVKDLADLDAPLTLHFELEVSAFARRQGASLVAASPLAASVHLTAFTNLEKRETPLLFPQDAALLTRFDVTVELPKGATLESELGAASGENGGRSFKVADRVEGGVLKLSREVNIPAGRIQPSDYAAFVAFARKADEAIHRDLIIKLSP